MLNINKIDENMRKIISIATERDYSTNETIERLDNFFLNMPKDELSALINKKVEFLSPSLVEYFYKYDCFKEISILDKYGFDLNADFSNGEGNLLYNSIKSKNGLTMSVLLKAKNIEWTNIGTEVKEKDIMELMIKTGEYIWFKLGLKIINKFKVELLSKEDDTYVSAAVKGNSVLMLKSLIKMGYKINENHVHVRLREMESHDIIFDKGMYENIFRDVVFFPSLKEKKMMFFLRSNGLNFEKNLPGYDRLSEKTIEIINSLTVSMEKKEILKSMPLENQKILKKRL